MTPLEGRAVAVLVSWRVAAVLTEMEPIGLPSTESHSWPV